jgi:hypothetical protein
MMRAAIAAPDVGPLFDGQPSPATGRAIEVRFGDEMLPSKAVRINSGRQTAP